MGAQRDRITWRFAFGQTVYLVGSHQPYIVDGHRYTSLANPLEGIREYRLQGPQGQPFWIYDEHVHPGPPRRSNSAAAPQERDQP